MADFPTQARVVIIGGGAVGASSLYHLAKAGWDDVMLLERDELTSGSTWHAAGLLPLFNMSYSVGQLHRYSVELYSQLEAETGQDVGLRKVSNIRLATNQDRMDEYHYYAGVAKTIKIIAISVVRRVSFIFDYQSSGVMKTTSIIQCRPSAV